ncbi:MAG: hypothetical protein ACK6DW_15320 [Betaproteobacteria bacterium]|jgi:IS5 family transposase
MERVAPWSAPLMLVEPHMPAGRRGRPPFPAKALLRFHAMQHWLTLQ